jgi:flagellar basal-body rod protein FlgG
VKLNDELVNLVVAQRAYEVNAKVIQASDEMLSISNNLRR